MTRIVWSEQAERDRLRHLDWYAEHSVATAERMAWRIVAQARLLQRFPRLGRVGEVAGTRYLPVPGTPLVLIYSTGEHIRILRLLHNAQNWPGRF